MKRHLILPLTEQGRAGTDNCASRRRIQRRRTKGWRMPEGAIYVGRPTRWGNPFMLAATEIIIDTRSQHHWMSTDAQRVVVDFYRAALICGDLPVSEDDVRHELAGHELACWCRPDQPCHADILLELANGATT